MRSRSRLLSLSALAVVVAPAASASAAVSLSITDGVGTPTAGNANRGGTFSFALNLVSTSEQTTGLGYFLETTAAGNGLFSIVDRNLTGSTYSDPVAPDATVEAAASALLDPRNNTNLGATVADPMNSPNGAGTFLVANYTISVSPTAPLGTYTIQTFSAPGAEYAGGPPNYSNGPFASVGTYSVTVVPEPAAAGLAGVGALRLLARRRRVGAAVA